MIEKDFLPSPYQKLSAEGKVTWKAPSNIALVKYWGKRANQVPANPSVSFTLRNCTTTTSVTFCKKEHRTAGYAFELLFEGKPREDFKPKIQTFFKRIERYVPFIKEYYFTIETFNSFPHSSGIASSASGMAALALCLLDIEKQMNPGAAPDFFTQKASFLARLGSGSACRSVAGEVVQWGVHPKIPESSNLYGINYPFEIHPVFQHFQDTILLVHQGQKQVSSTVGHQLMHNHPFAKNRFAQAQDHLDRLKPVFAAGDLEAFMTLVESEALTLHAMMMTSTPYFMLMKPHTLQIIQKIWNYREASKLPIGFTLDAGANVHVLYPASVKEKALQFITDALVVDCENGSYICDQMGTGPQKTGD